VTISHRINWTRVKNPPPPPKSEAERQALCGYDPTHIGSALAAATHKPFFIAGQTETGAGKSARIWELFSKVTGHDPDLTPQPTGNCVAASADDVIEGTQCVEIAAGEREKFHPVYNPYHYATGRVLIGKNRLRGGPGSIGSWQAEAIKQYGVIANDQDGLPAYTRANVDAWGDDRKASGKSFRDYLEQGGERLIRATALVDAWDLLRDGLFNLYLATIANNRGYTMKPGSDGYHHASGSWSHQRSLWGYSEEGPERDHWVAIKNQWGDVHGEVRDPQGNVWPRGFLIVPLQEFITKDLGMRGTECIIYSKFDGWPEQIHKIRHRINWGT